jgi:hypothetical protein
MDRQDPPPLLVFVAALALAAGIVIVWGFFLGIGLRLAGIGV